MDVEQAIATHSPRVGRLTATGAPVHAGPQRRGPLLQFGRVRQFEWNRLHLPIASLPPALESLRLLHLSDLHFASAWHPAHERLIERIQDDPPDLVLITGDFVDSKIDYRPAWPLVERLISGLRARFGVFGITGNHDGDFISPRLASIGVRVCTSDALRLQMNDAEIELIGLAGEDRQDLRSAFAQSIPPRRAMTPRIILSHYPDLLRRVEHLHVDLILAGHTHGGQVCLPGGIPVIRHDTLPRRYASGVHRVGHDAETWLVVSRGMGFSNYPIRVFCPAEVVEVVLKGQSDQRSALSCQPGNATAVSG